MKIFALTLVIFFLQVVPAYSLYTADTEGEEGIGRCFDCHGREGSVKRFRNNDVISVYINKKRYEASVHGNMPCQECHAEFTRKSHPERVFRSSEQYRIQAARACRKCHDDASLRQKSIHTALLEKERQGKASVCTDCHGSHEISPVKGGKIFTYEEQYCMGCHGHENSMAFLSKEKVSIKVDASNLHSSAHRNLTCSDCHFGYSSEAHPKRRFRTRRDYQLASAELCKRCHFDKYTKITESIHYDALSQGRLDAPTCTDCHEWHATSYASVDRLSSVRKCNACHKDIYVTYANSVHGNALFNEKNRDVPICIDCHTSHSIKDPTTTEYHELIPEMCSNCHANKAIMGKYGLSTDVVTTYLSDFHGVTLGLYKKEKGVRYKPERPIAVCTDCHGTHDITRTSEPNSSVVKENLLKRCQMCHKNATQNFPDAWLSHYEPTLSNAPAVYIVNSIYKVMMPVMVIGVFLQVFLHIWRYLVSR